MVEIVDINDQIVDNNTFMLSQTFGQLNGFDTIQIRVFFSPDKVGAYNQMLKIYYAEKKQSKEDDFFKSSNYKNYFSMSIHLSATAINRSLCFSQPQINLPNTYVGVPSRALVWIYNIGYKNTTKLSVFFPPELSKIIL